MAGGVIRNYGSWILFGELIILETVDFVLGCSQPYGAESLTILMAREVVVKNNHYKISNINVSVGVSSRNNSISSFLSKIRCAMTCVRVLPKRSQIIFGGRSSSMAKSAKSESKVTIAKSFSRA